MSFLAQAGEASATDREQLDRDQGLSAGDLNRSIAQHIALRFDFKAKQYCKSLLPAMVIEWMMMDSLKALTLQQLCRSWT